MPLPLRRFYGQKLVDAKKEEKEVMDKARGNSTQISRPTFQKS
jgi:hypothetical protein